MGAAALVAPQKKEAATIDAQITATRKQLARLLMRRQQIAGQHVPANRGRPRTGRVQQLKPQIFQLLAKGFTHRQIAAQLGIGRSAVSSALQQILTDASVVRDSSCKCGHYKSEHIAEEVCLGASGECDCGRFSEKGARSPRGFGGDALAKAFSLDSVLPGTDNLTLADTLAVYESGYDAIR